MNFLLWDTEYSTLWGRFLFSIPFVFGGLMGALVFSRGMQRRRYFYVRAAVCCIICCVVVFFLWPWAVTVSRGGLFALIGAYVLEFIMIVISVLICNRCSIRNAIFYAENGIAAFSIVKLLFDSFGILTINADIYIEPYGALYSCIYIGLGIAVYFLLYLLVRRQNQAGLRVEHAKLLIPTSVVLAVSIIFNIETSRFIYAYSLGADIIIMLKVLLLLC